MLNRTKPSLESIISSPKGKEIRIIGVDPGLGATGFGLIAMGSDGAILYRGSGVIRSPATLSFPQRIQRIYRRLAEEIKNYTPHLMAVEQPFFAKNVRSAMLLGQAKGVAILAAAEAGVEVHEYSPLEVKQAVVGYGRAAKEQVQAMIYSLLHPPKNLKADAADALAVALCLAHSFSWNNSLRLLAAQKSPAGTRWKDQTGDWLEGRG
ncbi:MAG: crossover junction endodeoxyribonuclease RuvC [Deltaproteobacteria bacterium]|nr:crossover junction endodeoxyribonuclease RuvC [Deltaproteobacteria bacterium]